MYKVIVAGSRGFDDYDYLCECLDEQLLELTESNDIIDDIQIVSGGAKGADKLGEKYAKERGYDLRVFPADWNKFGKRAGYLRNEQMAEYADACICFWDRESKGTKHMIDLANKKGIEVIVNETEEAEVVTDYDDKIQRTVENQERYENNKNKKNNNNVEVNNMKNMNMNRNNKEVRNYTIVCREGKALLLNNNTNKYSTLTDDNGSTTMAAIKLLASLVEQMEQTDNVLNIVFIPRNLGGILKLDAVDKWIANGNKTDNGTQLSDEYVEFAKYITDMRKWLGTNNLVLKIQGGTLIRENEKKLIDAAWRAMDKMTAKKPVYNRPAMNTSKPASPKVVQDVQAERCDNIEF